MSNQEKKTSQDSSDPKVKFREALEKKEQGQGIRNNNVAGGSKISGRKSSGNAPKMFRRKSGSQ